MGRELKNVEAGFKWPLNKVWSGFLMPEDLHPQKCSCCNGQGYNEATQELADTYYDSNNFGVNWTYDYYKDRDGNPATRPPWRILGNSLAWHNKITQDEVEALVAKNRLIDFTHNWTRETGWVRREDGYIPTAAEVNEWDTVSMGHDGINRSILIEARATRLGVFGYCEKCDGEGSIFLSPEQETAYNEWKETPVPEGDWYQVWETVSEGSPVTPAFETANELIEYLVKYGDNEGKSGGWTREAASKFVGVGYAPSLVISNGQFITANNMHLLD